MSQVGTPKHDPIPVGEIAKPPFARLPDPLSLFRVRSERLRALAETHGLRPYLLFLAGLGEAQHAIQDGLTTVDPPAADTLARAREFGMPPLDRARFAADPAFDATMSRLLSAAEAIDMPAAARDALANAIAADRDGRSAMVRAVLTDAVPVESLAEHVFTAAALQVHFARLAARLPADRLVPVGEGACPCCGGPPVASMVVGWSGAHGTRFCCCSLCGTLWNHVRIKCTICGSTAGIAYQEIEGGPGTIKAETCDACHSYVKILQQHQDPALDPVADDVASLALDVMMRETGYRRAAVNHFLLGY